MANSLLVAVVNGLKHLLENESCVLLGKVFLFNDSLEELTSATNLHDQVYITFVFEKLIQLNHMRMVLTEKVRRRCKWKLVPSSRGS